MKKSDRQALIKKLIKNQPIRKQEEVVELLNEQGIEVTQATISRDIKEMKLIKVSQPDGSFYYSLSSTPEKTAHQRLDKMLQDVVQTFEHMEKFVVLKTIPGNAAAVGILLEDIYLQELFTLITTDDKVLMIFKTEESGKAVYDKLATLIYG